MIILSSVPGGIEEEFRDGIHPQVLVVPGPAVGPYILHFGFHAFEAEVEIFPVRSAPDDRFDFTGVSRHGEQESRFRLLPAGVAETPVDGDALACFEGLHEITPVGERILFPEVFCGCFEQRPQKLLPDELQPLQRFAGDFLFRLIEEFAEGGEFGRRVNFFPHFVDGGGRGHGAEGSFRHLAEELRRPDVFQFPVEIFHFGSGFAEHQPVVFGDEGVDVRAVVPRQFEIDVCVEIIEYPLVGFPFVKGTEGVRRLTLVVPAYGPGGHLGDALVVEGASLSPFVGISPQPHLAPAQFARPRPYPFVVGLAHFRKTLRPGTGDGHHDLHAGGDGALRRFLVPGVGHGRHLASDARFFDPAGDVGDESPHIFVFAVPGDEGLAPGAETAAVVVAGHDAEESGLAHHRIPAEAGLGIAVGAAHHAPFGGRFPFQIGNAVKANLVPESFRKVTAAPHRVVGGGIEFSVGVFGEVFGMTLGEAAVVAAVFEAVTAGDIEGLGPAAVILKRRSLRSRVLLVVPAGVNFLTSALKMVRPVVNVDAARRDFRDAGDHFAVLAREVETHPGEMLQKEVGPEKRGVFEVDAPHLGRLPLPVVPARDDDHVFTRLDGEPVPVELRNVDAQSPGVFIVAHDDGKLPGRGGGDHGDRGAEGFPQVFCQLRGGEFRRGRRSRRQDHAGVPVNGVLRRPFHGNAPGKFRVEVRSERRGGKARQGRRRHEAECRFHGP